MATNLKIKVANLIFKILTWCMVSVIQLRKFGAHTSCYAITILGVIIAAGFFCPVVQGKIREYKNFDTIFIAAGGLIGTMLALVFSLSIIPIQRAVESFTPSVTRLYRIDYVTQIIFITLALFCLFSFIMAVDGVLGLPDSILLSLEMFFIAVSLDMLRWHHRRVTKLLEPSNAIHRLSEQIKKYIDKSQNRLARLAKIQRFFLSAEQKTNQSQEQIETALYAVLPKYHITVNTWIGELAEITQKAMSAGNINTASLAISAITKLACHYINCRKDNLILIPTADFMATDSDINKVLTPIYEHFKDINRNAVALKAETTSIHVVRAMGEIINCTTNLKARAFRNNSAPITYLPIGYLKEFILIAQRNGLDDVALEGSREILNIAINAPDNVQITAVHLPAIENMYKIVLNFLISNKIPLANVTLNDILTLLQHLSGRKHFQFVKILQDTMEKIETLVPFAIAHEKTFGSPFIGLPIAPPYDLSNSMSIGYLVEQATSHIERDKSKGWVNPYGQFMEINEVIYRHFRNLAEKVDFGTSFLLWHIIQTIKHIARVYLSILQKPEPDNYENIPKLIGQILWYEAFFWVVFSKATNIDKRHADEACDVLAWIVMSFYDNGHLDVDMEFVKTSTGNIVSIMNSYSKTCKDPNPYDVADFLISLWLIRLFAEAKKNTTLIKIIDEKIAKPKMFSDDKWRKVLEAFGVRKEQLNGRLSESDRFYSEEDATSLLQS
ncbi:MAG: DUF2254 domain-containing protein [Nitrospirae bacterium]|nr:DUF2254 domain-containing protein [Nitrospirota bacterium]